ncbi:MAG: porin [Variovorax sp.]
MKKSLVALAVLAAAGAASAQSSVTLFGIVDTAVSYYDAKTKLPGGGSVKSKQWGLTNSGYNSSRIGFRGTEDLGGGLAAGFWLEGALGNDNGTIGGTGYTSGTTTSSTIFFNRRSTVSLSGNFGEVRLGRDFTPTFWNDTTFDPYGTNGVGTNVLNSAHNAVLAGLGSPVDNNYVRSSNSVGYFLPPNLGGFYGQLQYAFHENTSTDGAFKSKGGQYVGGRFGYANGPLDVAVAYGQSTTTDTAALEVLAKTFNVGASYDLGVVKLFGELSQVKNSFDFAAPGDFDPEINGFLLGATAPIGAGLIRVSYSQAKADLDTAGTADPKSQKFAIGYVHNLSKRTALYTTYAFIKNKNYGAGFGGVTAGGAPGYVAAGTADRANGFDFGIRHSF